MNNHELNRFFADVQSGKVDEDQFKAAIDIHVQAQVAELKLNALQWKQRYENSNKMAKSYMHEFQARGLLYVPKIETFKAEGLIKAYNYQPQPKKD
jgi:hypothetical protein